MKILFVIESLGNGGAERVLLNILPVLQENGYTCEVATLFDGAELAVEFLQQGIKVHRFNIKFRWNFVSALHQLKQLIKNNNYDFVHAHLFFAHFYTGILKKFLLPRLKTVVTLHNLGYDADPAVSALKKLRKMADRMMLETFNTKLAVSAAVKESFRKHLQLDDIMVLHNGFPVAAVQQMAEAAARPLEYRDGTINIITPGRLVKEKGHKYLVEAVVELNKMHDNLRFFFAGEGPAREEIEDMIKDLSLQNVFLLGSLKQQELFGWISHADLVVIPSVSEGFPTIIGECMALGKAMVATNAGGIPDFIDEGVDGILVEVGNPGQLQDKISLLLQNRELAKELVENAMKKVRKFDIARSAAKHMELYKKLMD
ncbi:glycosyltransferase family 4 protein [Kaistella sp. PBT33-4]|uniref:glycosyltransferase family 4 protein n=1 Tax=Kaistella sp. PBT33-4 TaxID=3032000 RepID=UPI0023D8927A|nr:glycosyltransferase family 4 protein [Kaistella sp. PBT33-4]MDF0718782.1 glycosyltransferase family 4 protein [Kaistella sp. PBT33-4]